MMLKAFLLGIVVTAFAVAALFFLRFWRRTGDRLFLAFACAFAIEGANRLRFLALDDTADASPSIYLVRLLAFLLIVIAIVMKNRRGA